MNSNLVLQVANACDIVVNGLAWGAGNEEPVRKDLIV